MCVCERKRDIDRETHREIEEGEERESGCGDGGDKTLEIKYYMSQCCLN